MFTIRPMQNSEAESVLALWQAGCVEAVGHELSAANAAQVLKNLYQYAQHEMCYCLVAEDADEIVSFVTFCITRHAIEPGLVGEIEELYVQPAYRQQSVAKQLVYQAVRQLKAQDAGVILTRVAVDDAHGLAFWKSLNWEQDTVNFAIYSNVPSDPISQAVWDSYGD